MGPKTTTIDQYIKQFPEDVQAILQQVRETIHAEAPQAIEAISYDIPTFKLNGKNLVHFAGYAHHVGFYPGSEAVEVFKPEILEHKYKWAKGSIQFPLSQPMPLDFIRNVVKFRVQNAG